MGYGPRKLYGLWDTRILWLLIENEGGGAKKSWVRANYGLKELWVRRALTVYARPKGMCGWSDLALKDEDFAFKIERRAGDCRRLTPRLGGTSRIRSFYA
jgi:hypothetical protein